MYTYTFVYIYLGHSMAHNHVDNIDVIVVISKAMDPAGKAALCVCVCVCACVRACGRESQKSVTYDIY